MSESLIHTLIMALAFLLLFGSAEILYHKFKVKAELTRKYVHFSTGILTLFFPSFIGNQWFVLFLCGSFLLILLFSMKFKLLPSINAVDRVTRGSILYPIVVYGCFLMFDHYGNLAFYYIPILILAICDPIAALVGKSYPWKPYRIFGHSKTMSGSMAFFVSSVILSFSLVYFNSNEIGMLNGVIVSFSVALFTTFAEAITHKGYDNLTIPAVAMGALVVLESFGHL